MWIIAFLAGALIAGVIGWVNVQLTRRNETLTQWLVPMTCGKGFYYEAERNKNYEWWSKRRHDAQIFKPGQWYAIDYQTIIAGPSETRTASIRAARERVPFSETRIHFCDTMVAKEIDWP